MSSAWPKIIAVDGPAASGKGTLARKIATHYGLLYLDTGSLYRAVGYKIVQVKGNPEDTALAKQIAEALVPEEMIGIDLANETIGKAASVVSAQPAVRKALLEFQRQFAAHEEGAVLDGRDIGTVICPQADVKFFITASLRARAERRYKELQNKGFPAIYETVLEDLRRRDERDSQREIAPLQKAEDAIALDTTGMGAEEVFRSALEYIEAKRPSYPKADSV